MNETQSPETNTTDGQQTQVKEIIKGLFEKIERKKRLEAELENINNELQEYGLTDLAIETPAPRSRGPRGVYPECTVDTVKEFLKTKGKDGAQVSDLVKHFGQKFSTKKKEFEHHFKVIKVGTSKFWTLKK